MNYFRHILSILLAIWASTMTLSSQSTINRLSSEPAPVFGDSDYDSPEIRSHYLRQAISMTSQRSSRSGQKYYVRHNATGMNDGSSWADAFTHLEAALALAGTGDSVWVAQGTYYPGQVASVPFILANGIHLYGGFAGNETLLSQRNISLYPTILSGDIGQDDLSSPLGTITDLVGTNSLHVIYAVAGKTPTVIDGLTITAGQANGSLENGYGGGVMSFTMPGDTFRMYVNNCTFQGNQASRGGGIGIRGINGARTNLEISHSSFLNNHAQTTSFWTASGAAIECFMNTPGSVMKNDYADCEFKGNTSQDNGGSIHHRDFVDIIDSTVVKRCVFDNNQSVSGNPGFSIYGQNGVSGAIIIDSCMFTNNSMDAGFGIGGGVAIASDNGKDTLKVDVSNCLFEDNTSWSGGGMSVEAFKVDPLAPGQVVFANITDCDFINNETFVYSGYEPFTGGLNLMAASSELNVNIKSCHVEGNFSNIAGGIGIYSFNGSVVKAEVSDCFISGNLAKTSSGGLGAFCWTKFPDFPLNQDTATLFLSVDDCLILNNQSGEDAAGIGLELFGGAYANATFFKNEFIENHTARLGSGGGLAIIQQATLAGNVISSVDSCYFEGNHAVKGGGFAVDAKFNGFVLDLMVNQSEFVKNTSVNGGGMYVYNRGGNELSIKTTNLSFLQDSAENQGGAIYGGNDVISGSLKIESENTLVSGNYSKHGAISFSTVLGLISNSWTNGTFVSNTSTGLGSGGAMTQKKAIGINNFSIANSIFWDNKRDSIFSDIFVDGASGIVGSSILQDTSTGFTAINQNPQFADILGPDSIPGSGDENLQLQETSPAINAGDNSFATSPFDLAGNARIQKDTVDLGAYESPFYAHTTTRITPLKTPAISIRTFPNPATTEISLMYQQDKAGFKEVVVMNPAGQIVLTKREFQFAGYHLEKLDIHKLNPGVYLIILECAERIGVQKFLKKN